MTFELSLDNSQITTYLLPKKHVYISPCLLMNTNNLFRSSKAQKTTHKRLKVKKANQDTRHSLTL